MELLMLILAFITIPAVIYQSIIIDNLNEEIENYKITLRHQEDIIKYYEKKIIKG